MSLVFRVSGRKTASQFSWKVSGVDEARRRLDQAQPGLQLAATAMQDRFGITVRLLAALEHQLERCLEGNRAVKIAGHRCILCIIGVLAVDDGGHALHRLDHLRLGDDAVMQPVRHVLRRDAQSGTILHQADIVDVGHLGATDALIDPAHDVAENALRVVIELALDFLWRPVRTGRDRNRQYIAELGPCPALQAGLNVGDIDPVIMRSVQGRSRRRRHPGGIGTRLRVGDLLLQHRRHQVRHGPHALADLRMAGKPAFETDVDVPVFVSADPGGLFHVALADHRTGFHRSVDLVAGAIEETGVDEDDAFARGADALLEIDRRAALLVHDAHLHGVGGHAECRLDAREDLAGESDFFRPMHLRLDDID
ncbi:hypothetical protein BKP54_28915 [Ensifer sp. 1H6]|nr:hypothetical protein BKP54_28915 [Ensifer sp. 1H6]